jgi:hypothetical protein
MVKDHQNNQVIMSTLIRYTLEDGSKVNIIPDDYTGIATTSCGSKFWYQDGKLHRLDGPTCEWYNGTKIWCQYGKYHRLEGPAKEWADGKQLWWINGKWITKATKIICIR